MLNGFISETREEYLVKPSPLQTRDELKAFIEKTARKGRNERRGTKIYVDKKVSDFDIIKMPRLTHFTDHTGNYITKTGYKIDDYYLNKGNQPRMARRNTINKTQLRPNLLEIPIYQDIEILCNFLNI